MAYTTPEVTLTMSSLSIRPILQMQTAMKELSVSIHT